MSRYIDKEKALQKIRDHISPAKEWLIEADNDYTKARADATIGAFVEIGLTIRDMPTAAVEPVRHGHWERVNPANRPTATGTFKCSECGNCYIMRVFEKYNFCPHCGAKMDGKEDEE